MFQSSGSPASLYAQVSLDTGVNTADPHRLVEMLFEKAEQLLTAADQAIVAGDISKKGESITRVIRIIDEGLRASLNPAGGEIGENLGRLYDYMLSRLLYANQNNSRETISEVRQLISQIHEPWSAIGPPGQGGRFRNAFRPETVICR